jgi:Ca2+-binding RTX toxin-like protein
VLEQLKSGVVSIANYQKLDKLYLVGTNSDDQITGSSWNEVLLAHGGDDILHGGDGDDLIDGGDGEDVADYADAVVGVKVNLGTVGSQNTGGGGLDTLVSIEGLIGSSFNDELLGNANSNILYGGGGSDVLDGGAGDDVLVAGVGAGQYLGGDGRDKIDLSGLGVDLVVNLRTGEVLGAGVTGTSVSGIEDVKSGSGDDTVVVGSGDHYIDGGGGEDEVQVLGKRADYGVQYDAVTGVLSLLKGSEAITLVGVEGVRFADGLVALSELTKASEESGADIVGTQSDDQLSGTPKGERISGLGGNDRLTGQGGSDVLDGGIGMDVMLGNGGNDSYYVDSGGDRVQEDGDGGIDTVFSTVDWSLGANIERLVLLSPARKGVGNGLDNELLGNARDNWLDGGLGADTMAGQSGNDTYVVNDIQDMVQEASQGGVDTVLLKLGQAYQRYEMSENVERVLVQGRLATDVQGNAGGNSLLGNVGDNRLWGLDGDDVLSGGMGGLDFLYGGAGDDVYYVQHRKTLVLEIGDRGADAGGHDTVISRVEAYALGAYVEDLVLSGGGKKGWGNMLDNRLVGNVMDNELVGFGGDDVLAGGAGNDVLIGGSGEDWFLVDALGRGVDQWLDFDVSHNHNHYHVILLSP